MQGIPTWLDAPPDGVTVEPPVDTREQTLPFNGLTWQNFERLVLRLVRRESQVIDCTIFGTQGQAQDGIDVLALRDANKPEQVCYQCKRVSGFTASDIRDAVKRFTDGKFAGTASTLVLCVSVSLERTEQVEEFDRQRDALRAQGIGLERWDGAGGGALAERLKPLPELVDDFFGRIWVERFNGTEASARLGERLDGGDRHTLLARLQTLYTSLFNRHDPGPLTPDRGSADFAYRYVQPDVVETLRVARGQNAQFESAGPRTPPGSQNASGQLRPEPSNSPIESQDEIAEIESRRPLLEWLRGRRFAAVIGEAGYGKSAFLRYLALSLLRHEESLAGKLDPEQLRLLPVWLSFAAFSAVMEKRPETSVEEYFSDWLNRYGFADVAILFRRGIRSSQVIFLIDGLDEVHVIGRARLALDRLVVFIEGQGGHVLCTARPTGFSAAGIPQSWSSCHLAPFSDPQILELASRAIAIAAERPSSRTEFEQARQRSIPQATGFLGGVRTNARTHQLCRTPLLCGALIELFQRSPRLPEARVDIYKDIINLLLTRHPSQRARAADESDLELPGSISVAECRRMLMRLAIAMHRGGLVTASTQLCVNVFSNYLQDAEEGLGRPKAEARALAESLVSALSSRLGIFAEKAPEEYGFIHLSIQEFLTAEAVSEFTEEEQIAWVKEAWGREPARDCVLNWFGLQGDRGRKKLAGEVAALITSSSQTSELQRIRALELCAELACSDLGLPVKDSREYVELAARSAETSPFAEHRIAIARSLAIGGITSSVRDECRSIMRRWLPGRSEYERKAIVQQLAFWQPSADLREALIKGIRDESILVRRASAETLANSFRNDGEIEAVLRKLAISDVQLEVRAAATRALRCAPTWRGTALAAADANAHTTHDELALEVVAVRVAQGVHSDSDLHRLGEMRGSQGVKYWLREDYYAQLLGGWRQDQRVKTRFVDELRSEGRRHQEIDETLLYVVKAFPGDNEIASLLAKYFEGDNLGGFHTPELWSCIREGFRGHPVLAGTLRSAIQAFREKMENIFWSPAALAYTIIGDSQARDEVIAAYSNSTHRRDRSWIASTLIEGWWSEPNVQQQVRVWATSNDVDLSAPLAPWSKEIFGDGDARREWLIKQVRTAPVELATAPIRELLSVDSAQDSLSLVRDRLDEPGIWYYSRVKLQAELAAAHPASEASERVREAAFAELDGPPIHPWVRSIEHDAAWRARVLWAAFPVARDVRSAVASTMRARVASDEVICKVIPEYLAESSANIRTTFLCALAQANSDPGAARRATLEAQLFVELRCLGTYYRQRHLSALAAMVEMGSTSLAAKIIAESEQKNWPSYLIDILEPDSVAMQVLISAWDQVRSAFDQEHLPAEFPIDAVLRSGNTQLLTQKQFASQLDERLRNPPSSWDRGELAKLIALQHPRSDLLRSFLLAALKDRGVGYASLLVAAQLIAEHFSGDQTTWELLWPVLSGPGHSLNAPGLAANIVYGWPERLSEIESVLPIIEQRSPIDELMLASISGDCSRLEHAGEALLAIPRDYWTYQVHLTEILTRWATLPRSKSLLKSWSANEDATKSMSAVALLAATAEEALLDLPSLQARFEREFAGSAKNSDGFDLSARETRSWCVSLFPTLRRVA